MLLPLTLLSALVRASSRGAGPRRSSRCSTARSSRRTSCARVRHEHQVDATHGFWSRVGDRAAANPKRTFAGAVAVLPSCACGLAFFSTDLTTNDSYTTKVESVEGQELLAKASRPGSSAPTDIIVARRGRRRAGRRRRSRRVAGVEAVSPPVAEGEDGRVLLQATLDAAARTRPTRST